MKDQHIEFIVIIHYINEESESLAGKPLYVTFCILSRKYATPGTLTVHRIAMDYLI